MHHRKTSELKFAKKGLKKYLSNFLIQSGVYEEKWSRKHTNDIRLILYFKCQHLATVPNLFHTAATQRNSLCCRNSAQKRESRGVGFCAHICTDGSLWKWEMFKVVPKMCWWVSISHVFWWLLMMNTSYKGVGGGGVGGGNSVAVKRHNDISVALAS